MLDDKSGLSILPNELMCSDDILSAMKVLSELLTLLLKGSSRLIATGRVALES